MNGSEENKRIKNLIKFVENISDKREGGGSGLIVGSGAYFYGLLLGGLGFVADTF